MHKIMINLHRDHMHLDKVFNILEQQVELISKGDDPDLFLMVDIANYVQHYPDLVHHPMEDKVYEVFKNKSDEGADIVSQLQGEHKTLPSLTNELRDMLESAANSVLFISRDELNSKITDFLEIERKHMNLEEDLLFPLINKILTREDWNTMDLEIIEKNDPIFGGSVESCYENLYQFISRRGDA